MNENEKEKEELRAIDEIKAQLMLLKQTHRELLIDIDLVEKEIHPLLQKKYKLQERAANIRLEFDILERKRVVAEKPSPQHLKALNFIMKTYKVDKEIAEQLLPGLLEGGKK